MSDIPENKKITADEVQKTFKDAVDKVVSKGFPPSALTLIDLIESVQNDEAALEALKQEIIKYHGQ